MQPAAQMSGVNCRKLSGLWPGWIICVPVAGQGLLRSACIEAAVAALTDHGFSAIVYGRMD